MSVDHRVPGYEMRVDPHFGRPLGLAHGRRWHLPTQPLGWPSALAVAGNRRVTRHMMAEHCWERRRGRIWRCNVPPRAL